MIKIKYNDLPEMVNCTFSIINDNVIQLEGGLEDESGFLTYRMDGETQLGDFSYFRTIYRVIDGAVQYSNNYTVYEEEPLPEYDNTSPTIEERINDIENALCELFESLG